MQFTFLDRNLTNDIHCAATALNENLVAMSGSDVRFVIRFADF